MIDLMQFMQTTKNPQAFMQQIMSNSQIMKNPMAKNTMEMLQNGNNEGLEKLARNLCKEKGINPEEALTQIKLYFGM